jgi:hypothetical protein
MGRAKVSSLGVGAVLGVALVAACGPGSTQAPGAASGVSAPPLCLGNVISSDPWLIDSTCSCSPGGTPEFEDACSYEQGLVACLKQVGYPLSDCSAASLPPLWFVLGSDKRRWSVLDPEQVRGFDCSKQAELLQCIASLNATGKGPDGAPFTKFPVEGQEIPYCTPPVKGCGFNKVDAFDPCAFKGCIQ